MINETKDTSANEWCVKEDCEKLPYAVNLAFFTVTSSLRNKIHALQLKILFNIMMAVRLCFEKKKILSLSYTKEENYSNRFKF